jgi:hypothetical protein
LLALFLVGAGFLVNNFDEFLLVLQTLRAGDPRWLGLALVVHLLWIANVAGSFKAIYRALGIDEQLLHLAKVTAAVQFVNVVAPSGGMGGAAVLLADGKKRGWPAGRVTTCGALFVFGEQLSLLAVISLGLLVLFQLNHLNAAEVLAALILGATALVTAWLLALGMEAPDALTRALYWVGERLNRILKPLLRRELIDLSAAHTFAHDVHEGLQEVRRTPSALLLPAALAVTSKLLLLMVLALVFLAFGQPPLPGTLVASFGVGYLFFIVSPTPSGIGFVEGAMTLVLTTLGIPFGKAAVITLAFRGITLWLTILYGMLTVRSIGLQPRPEPN